MTETAAEQAGENSLRFAELMEREYAKVYYHCLKIMKNDQDAADATQETFIRAFIHRNRVLKNASLEAWIFAIANNEIRMFYRKRQRNENKPFTAAKPSVQKDYAALYAALDSLEEEKRNLVMLRYFSGLSLRQTALMAGISEKTAKSRLFEARKKLAFWLTGDSVGENLPELRKRRNRIMSIVNQIDAGTRVIPFMSAWGQRKLLEDAKENRKFSAEVLTEFSRIEHGKEFVLACNGSLSYDELLRILACCDEPMLYRLNSQEFKTWRNGNSNPILMDIAEYTHLGGYVDSVEIILTVPSIMDTVRWYQHYLGWESDCTREDAEKYGHAIINAGLSESARYMTQSFKGIHLRKGEAAKGSCFVFVSAIEKLRDKILENGYDKPVEITDSGWGTKRFNVIDLNGFVLEFCEWGC